VDFDFSGLGFTAGDGVVVTGAASGIGRATARLAARSGLTVVGWDMATEGLDAAVAELNETGAPAHAVVCDVSDQESIERAWERTLALATVPYLVNNAGPPSGTDVSLVEGLRLSIGSMAAVTDAWLARAPGVAASVTFTSSVAGNFTATTGATALWYPVAKTALAAYTRELAVKRRGRPRANAVAPSLVETPRTAHMIAAATSEEALRRLPLGRIAQPEDVAACICFLLSPAASFVNGVLLPVDGASSWV
jgi:NAD(P)-dependent dehydrogenase (short-subunit alcohol dehydrogenase family)